MNIIPFVHEGLGNSSYLMEVATDEAVLVDPLRSVDQYLRAAEDRGWRIRTVLETHLHADFVSGALEVAQAMGAEIFVPQAGSVRFPHRPVQPGERIRIGGFDLEAIASPGHTSEHLSYVLRAAQGPPALFSGGSLIVGGAARTDLIAPEMTDSLTHSMFRTLKTAFTSLPDETLLFPNHGGGSFCSAVPGADRTSTLGLERRQNAVLAVENEDEFVRWFPTTFPAIPAYFFRMRPINQEGPRLRERIAPSPPLQPNAFDAALQPARETLIANQQRLLFDPLQRFIIAHEQQRRFRRREPSEPRRVGVAKLVAQRARHVPGRVCLRGPNVDDQSALARGVERIGREWRRRRDLLAQSRALLIDRAHPKEVGRYGRKRRREPAHKLVLIFYGEDGVLLALQA